MEAQLKHNVDKLCSHVDRMEAILNNNELNDAVENQKIITIEKEIDELKSEVKGLQKLKVRLMAGFVVGQIIMGIIMFFI